MDKTKIQITMKKYFILITICLITGFAAAQGRGYEINIYGSKKLTPILPWIK
jgi:hypothetical protein